MQMKSEKEKDNEDIINDTKEINLDELYDGSVNGTVVMDPVTNSEILIENKRSGIWFILLLIIVIALLLLYFIKMKTPIGNTTKAVVPITTKTTSDIATTTNNISEEKEKLESGRLTCLYEEKTNDEEQTSSFTINYKDSKIINTIFNYDVISILDTESKLTSTLKNEYENFYINNAALEGNNITYVKNEKGFNFKMDTNYETFNFDLITFKENETKLIVKPSINDTHISLKENYELIGYKCNITSDMDESRGNYEE